MWLSARVPSAAESARCRRQPRLDAPPLRRRPGERDQRRELGGARTGPTWLATGLRILLILVIALVLRPWSAGPSPS